MKDNWKQRAAAGPTVSIGDVTVSGGMPKQAVLKTIRKIEGGIADAPPASPALSAMLLP